jgi:hypothetical protein
VFLGSKVAIEEKDSEELRKKEEKQNGVRNEMELNRSVVGSHTRPGTSHRYKNSRKLDLIRVGSLPSDYDRRKDKLRVEDVILLITIIITIIIIYSSSMMYKTRCITCFTEFVWNLCKKG